MSRHTESRTSPSHWPLALLGLGGGLFSLGVAVLTVLCEWVFASAYLSQSTWQSLVIGLGGQLEADEDGATFRVLLDSPEFVVIATALCGGIVWAAGAWLASRLSGRSWGEVATSWAVRGGRWLCLLLLWSQGPVIAYLLGAEWLEMALLVASEFYWAIVFGLVAMEWWPLTRRPASPLLVTSADADDRFARRLVWGAFAAYSLVFVAMNWGLWFNLRIPHGDSAMYEEHLWNLTHGKGFRSYLDQGLFLGEHIQVIHLALLPLHWLWPSHLLLELCQSLGIAAVVFPLYSIAKRHTGQPRLAAGVAVLALLAFPLHYLDISIDVKTFRPTAFGVAVVLAAIDAFEAKRFRWMLAWVLIGLSAQEDFALAFGPLGLWIAWDGWRKKDRSQTWLGLGLLIGSAAYLLLVMKVLLPYFREGVTIHYASYFAKFGNTPGEIVWTMLTQPGKVWGALVTASSFSWGLCLLVPLGLLPLLSPSRLLTAAPLLVLLCLNELARNPPGPFHHFHAPVLPLLLWAAAAGLGRVARGESSKSVAGEDHALHQASGRATLSSHAVMAFLTTGVTSLAARFRPPLPRDRRGFRLECIAGERVGVRGPHAQLMPPHPGPLPHSGAPSESHVECGGEGERVWKTPRETPSGRCLAWRPTGGAVLAFSLTCGVWTGLVFSHSPLSVKFWDPGQPEYWRNRYLPDERPTQFAKIADLIPLTARVASTDFVHPRYTHFERSYDYSQYPRKVNGNRPGAPPDTDFIVIDTRHPYSWIQGPEDVTELLQEPDKWELLPDTTEGYFLVLKRRSTIPAP